MVRAARARSHPGLRLAAIRRFHLFIGVFIAPSVLFFALTGSMQLFSLHEAHRSYEPPNLIAALGKVHKDQVFAVEKKEPHGPAKEGAGGRHDHVDEGSKATTIALKVFFLAVAAGLIASTCLGLWMALISSRDKAIAWLLLLAGAVIPIALLVI